ncbi:CRE-SRV-14 protein [Caenorhabditis remanei]|uniref:CRE-SRV-14 protein n=1 Tax=Caenorhabditis remanei TaxID=31234 RepID=E3MEH0_CAERE|nr:CRE-SRV-14 protein [Caenorhabditis remanei]
MTSTFFIFGGAFLFINCLYLIIAYCYLLTILKKRNSRIGKTSGPIHISKSKQKIRKSEMRLFIMCTLIVAVQLTILLFFSLKQLKFFELSLDEFYLFYNALSDLFACINPYLLWIFSDSLRKYVLSKLGLRKHGSGITTGVPRLTMQSVVPVS